MDLSSLYNPYDFANPISDAALLVGRNTELSEIKYYLDNAKAAPRPINIALLGQRASGKTSLLNIIEIECTTRGLCPIRINLDEDDARFQLVFFMKLFDAIISVAFESGAFGGLDGKTYDTYIDIINTFQIPEDKAFCPLLFPLQYAKALGNNNANAQVSDHSIRCDLIKLREQIGKPIVLLFDEGNVLAQNRALLQKLRNTFMNITGFMLVMTGTPDLFPAMDEVFSPIVRQFKKINVGEFKKSQDTSACIRKPLEKVGIVPEHVFDFETYRDVVDIHNLSGGRPYEIQFICHILFRRVQSKRADSMKLDFGVLEEVRRELETWQDISSRPVLTKIRSLDAKRLAALGELTSCNGYATFDQIWAFEYTFGTNGLQNKEELREAFQYFVNEGILELRNERIWFIGDDFDKIYAKYFAREQGISLSVQSAPLDWRWSRELEAFIAQRLEQRLVPISRYYSRARSVEIDIVKVAEKMRDAKSNEDVFVDCGPIAEDLYCLMVDYRSHVDIPLIRVSLAFPWLTTEVTFRVSSADDIDALEMGHQALVSLKARIEEVGGNLDVESLRIPTSPLEVLSEKVEETANKIVRASLSGFHAMKMHDTYLDDCDIDSSLLHAKLCYRYDPSPDPSLSNDIGYVFLSAGDLDEARRMLCRALEESEINLDKGDDFQIALSTYNLGIVEAQSGNPERAKSLFYQSRDEAKKLAEDEMTMGCLWVPLYVGDVLTFEERREPNLLLTATEAWNTLVTSLSVHEHQDEKAE